MLSRHGACSLNSVLFNRNEARDVYIYIYDIAKMSKTVCLTQDMPGQSEVRVVPRVLGSHLHHYPCWVA
jgi:hypothetical protein